NKQEKINALEFSNNIVYMNEMRSLEEDNKYLPYLYMIRDNKTIEDYDTYDIKENNYILSTEDILYLDNFVSLFDFVFPEFSFDIPVFSNNSKELLRSLSSKGLLKRLNYNVPKIYSDRLKYEISVIEQMGFIDYFLIVYDYVKYAKQNNIVVGPGRGSGAGSLVCYSLGITEIDPIKYNLIFERFLNPDRITMPDIDIDFEFLRRNEVVDYVIEKYGRSNVANIITFGTLASKAVIRDVSRVLNIEVSLVSKIVKCIHDKDTLKDLENNNNFISLFDNDERLKLLLTISKKFEGLKRHTSIHAAGIVISKDKLCNKVPLYKSGSSILTCYSMEYLERMGLLKMDFLALSNLTIIDNIIKKIKIDMNIDLKLNLIPLNDTDTLKLYKEGNTLGIFQFESYGIKSFLRKLDVSSFDDIVSAIALYRPGPMGSIDTFIRRKKGIEKIEYIIPELESILKSTNGIIIYQEQILEILKSVGGYTYAEADNIRRAMSKKKESVIFKEKDIFVSRCIKKGIEEKKAASIYDLVLKFANYGFNKSHSVAYALIGYQMAYLKVHYNEEFLSSLLDMSVNDNIKTKMYLEEALSSGYVIKGTNVNISDINYVIKDKLIYLPLNTIKNISEETAFIINKNKPYMNYLDFISKVFDKISVSKIENIIMSGSLDLFNLSRKTMMNNLKLALNYSSLSSLEDKSIIMIPELVKEEEYNIEELMDKEFELFGFYIKNHPILKYNRDKYNTLSNFKNYFDKIITLILYVESIKVIDTKNKEKMCFITLSDEYDKCVGIMFPKVFKTLPSIEKGNIIKITGKVEKRMDKYQIIISSLEIVN
ncbi:MAG: DNA polymerase III subunit alpha, partial [Bacilli bacterium]